jgi:hypothetical protein
MKMNPTKSLFALTLLTACGPGITHKTMDVNVVNESRYTLTVVAEESCWDADIHTFEVAPGKDGGVDHTYECHGERLIDRVTITFADYVPASSTFYTFDTAPYLQQTLGVGSTVSWLEDGALRTHTVTSSDTGYSEVGRYVKPATSFAVAKTSVHLVPSNPDATMQLGIPAADYPQYVPRPSTAEERDGLVFLPMTRRTYTFPGKGAWRNTNKGGPIDLVCDDFGCRGGSL